ncbi:OsmC family protein [Cyclobacterium amurskyense]|uniref:OsmC family protein n=1 Tax=Cyclobacterium amurskyense TaxID=320787 RepID=A0A0H4PKN5_9BACT|nr:OsmC family protein [Cyclobacterium amurskyense]AKP53600.1 OsmC family protein [Cyclobacterium amurskyense]
MSELVQRTFQGIIEATKKDVSLTKGVFRVTSEMDEHVRVKNTARDFEFIADEPEALAGTNLGPNPVEYLLASLGSCQVITYQVVASLKGIQLNNVKVETKGNIDWRGFLGIDENVRPGYHKIEVETFIDSDESPERIQELIKEVEARCPVLDNLVNTVKVESKISIVNEKNPVV